MQSCYEPQIRDRLPEDCRSAIQRVLLHERALCLPLSFAEVFLIIHQKGKVEKEDQGPPGGRLLRKKEKKQDGNHGLK